MYLTLQYRPLSPYIGACYTHVKLSMSKVLNNHQNGIKNLMKIFNLVAVERTAGN